MKTPKKIYLQINDQFGFAHLRLTKKSCQKGAGYRCVKYIPVDLAEKEFKKTVEASEDIAELTWKDIQDIWFITREVLKSIPKDFSKWEEWMFSTQGRFTKALKEVKKYREKNGKDGHRKENEDFGSNWD